jgi:AcrR family transcriptional regulator
MKVGARRRPQARRGEGDKLRDEILTAAEQLLLATGSEEAVSIRAVADAIGVTPPAIYRHFHDKSSLLFEVCGEHFERMDRFVVESSSHLDDPVEVLCQRAQAYVRFAEENPEHYRIMFMGRATLTPEQYADEMLVESGSFAHFVQCVEACIDAGRFRPELDDAFAVTLALWAMVHGLASLVVAKPDMPGPSVNERLHLLLEIALRGVLRDGSP